MTKIRVGIVGYGNLGKGVEKAIQQNPDMELVAIFSRRDPKKLETKSKSENISELESYVGKIDIMYLCGGSATDLVDQGPEISKLFNTVDSFDNHAKIPEHYEKVNKSASENNNLSLISTGWDPGLFSLNRVLGESVLPKGKTYTFWGKGVSQGHSDAIRRIDGVKYGVQYTIPSEDAINTVKKGKDLNIPSNDRHERVCYVVSENDIENNKIREEIVTMPNYFADYKTTVNFISEEEFKNEHMEMPHGGVVLRSGKSVTGSNQIIEFKLDLDSNPEFTSSVLVACGRAVFRLRRDGQIGAISILDIPIGKLSPKTSAELRKEFL